MTSEGKRKWHETTNPHHVSAPVKEEHISSMIQMRDATSQTNKKSRKKMKPKKVVRKEDENSQKTPQLCYEDQMCFIRQW